MPTNTSGASLPANTLEGLLLLTAANKELLATQRDRYDQLVLQYDGDRFQSVGDDDENAAAYASNGRSSNLTDTAIAALDPLSLMVHQQDLREEKEARQRTARRKSNIVDIVLTQEIVGVVKKDLNRLHDEHASYYRSRANWRHHCKNEGEEITDFETAIEKRNELLTQILHTYGKAHFLPGYQQGMHEICSYLMFVLEMDLFDVETSECTDYEEILSSNHVPHDTFSMTEAILTHMEQAFGVADEGHAKPVEEMGDSILHKVQYVACDKNLYMHLKSMEWSLGLYCARWVRLLFAREVAGWRNVLSLWDICLDCITETDLITSMPTSKYTRPGLYPMLKLGGFDLMTVLETTAASFLWLCRDQLLSHQADEGLQAVTGMDPLQEVGPLISTVLSSLRRLQISKNMAPLMHPDQKNSNNKSPNPRRGVSPGPATTILPGRSDMLNRAASMSRVMSALPLVSSITQSSPVPTRRAQRRRSSLQHVDIQDMASITEQMYDRPPIIKSASTSNRTMSELVTNYIFSSEPASPSISKPKSQRMRRDPSSNDENNIMTELVDLDKSHMLSQPVVSDEESLRQSFFHSQKSVPQQQPEHQYDAPPRPQERRWSSLQHYSNTGSHSTLTIQQPRRTPRRSSLNHSSSFGQPRMQEQPQPRRAARRNSLGFVGSWMASSASNMPAAVTSLKVNDAVVVGPTQKEGSSSPAKATNAIQASANMEMLLNASPDQEGALFDESVNRERDQCLRLQMLLSAPPLVGGDSAQCSLFD
jgi:hypothetical protein